MDEILPFSVKAMKDMSSEEVVSFVAGIREVRMKPLALVSKSKKNATDIPMKVVSEKILKAALKVEKLLATQMKADQKVDKAVAELVALRAMFRLDDVGQDGSNVS